MPNTPNAHISKAGTTVRIRALRGHNMDSTIDDDRCLFVVTGALRNGMLALAYAPGSPRTYEPDEILACFPEDVIP